MAEHTGIEWATHTWSPWVGCTKVSPACDRCYAETWAKRTGHPELWQGARSRTSVTYWKQPLRWNRKAEAAGERWQIFPSLCDPFDNQAKPWWRQDMWDLISKTPHLDYMLLTKRPQNIAKMLPHHYGFDWLHSDWPWRNVWIGATVENREEAKRRLPHLRDTPAHVRFVSFEPLLEDLGEIDLTGIHMAIVGGETGRGWRDMNPAWARSLRDQCKAAGTAFFFKQMSNRAPIPDDLMLREFPKCA